MNEETANRLISILESIDSKLDSLTEIESRLSSIEEDVRDMKMDISGFSHEGKTYPGKLDSLETSLSQIESELSSMSMSLHGIESNTSG